MQVDIVLPQSGEGQWRFELLSLAVLVLDVLVEQLQEGHEHHFVKLEGKRLLDDNIHCGAAVNIVR